ncbi:MAG: ABC transporter permease, partial [Acidobacteriaceae bacterium]|nr:ABC transporter permease [Acidobacteriaceae bacterium]
MRSRAEREQDLTREIESHLNAEAEEQRSAGVPPEYARAAASRVFGNATLVREEVRAAWSYRWFDALTQDLRYGARGLRRNPAFATVIVLSLALGIGMNTAIFSVLNAVLLRTVPVPHPEELYSVDISESKFRAPQRFSYPQFVQMREVAGGQIAAMSRVARMYGMLDGEKEQETARVQLVSGEYFSLLGVAPSAGRLLTPADNVEVGQHPVAVVSHAYWQKKGGSASTLGRSVHLNGATFTIIGVAGADFNGLWLESPVDIWIPLMMQAVAHYQQNFSSSNADMEMPWPKQEGIRWLDFIVRKPESLPALRVVFQQWLQGHAAEITDAADRQLFLRQQLTFDPVARGFSYARSEIQGPLSVLAGMVALVLLIACANSANLMLARGAARQREMAVRLSIGASRSRVIRQLLTETCLLVTIATALGVTAGQLGNGLLVRAALGVSSSTPVQANFDWRVLGFSAALCIATIMLCGLAPAIRTADAELDRTAKSGARGVSSASLGTLQKALVAAQIALVFVLLVGAAWFSGSLRYLAQLNLGYDQEQVVTVWLRPDLAGYSQERLPALHRRLVESVEAVPGVQSAVFAMCGLASGCRNSSSINIEGYQPAAGENVEVQVNRVGLHYFTTVGMRLLAGRDFTEHDSEKARRVAIVNEAAVGRYFPGGNAIGRRLGSGKPGVEIVGIVADARFNSEREPARPMAFYPLVQGIVFGGCVEVRVAGLASARIEEIRQAIRSVDP